MFLHLVVVVAATVGAFAASASAASGTCTAFAAARLAYAPRAAHWRADSATSAEQS